MGEEAGMTVSNPTADPRRASATWLNHLFLVLLMLAIVAIWGWTFSLMKAPIEQYGVVPFLALRFAIGSAALALFAAPRANRASLRVGLWIGLLVAACYLLQTFGLRYTTATNTGLITGLFIIFAPLTNRLFFNVKTPGTLWVAMGFSILGLALLAGTGSSPLAAGDALTLMAAAGFGLHIALLDRYARHHDPLVLTLGQILAATAVFIVIGPCVARFSWPTPQVWFALLVTGLLATAVAFLVQTYVQRRLSAVETATIIVLEPVFAAIFGYLLLREVLTPLQCVGAALMVGAMAAVEVYPRLMRRDGSGPHAGPGGLSATKRTDSANDCRG